MSRPSQSAFLRTAIFCYPAPKSGIAYSATSWKSGTPATYSHATPTSGLAIGPFILGQNAARYQRALIARGLPAQDQGTNPNTEWRTTGITKPAMDGGAEAAVMVYGETAVHLLSMFPDVWLGDFPPEELLRDILAVRRPGSPPMRFHIGFFNLESINQRAENNTLLDAWRVNCRNNVLTSNTNGTHSGQNELDQYEDDPYTGAIHPADLGTTGHSWMVKPSLAGQAAALGALKVVVQARYTGAVPISTYFWDNVLDFPYFGLATNRPSDLGGTGKATTDPTGPFKPWCDGADVAGSYVETWRAFADAFRTSFLPHSTSRLGANSGFRRDLLNLYNISRFEHRFDEFHFHDQASGGAVAAAQRFHSNDNPATNPGHHDLTSKIKLLLQHPKAVLFAGILMRSGSAEVDNWLLAKGPGVVSGVDKGDWSKLRKLVSDYQLNSRYVVVTARSANGGTIFWVPEFGPVA